MNTNYLFSKVIVIKSSYAEEEHRNSKKPWKQAWLETSPTQNFDWLVKITEQQLNIMNLKFIDNKSSFELLLTQNL